MVPAGHREYKRREFCNDIPCFVQVELNKHQSGSEKYEKIRSICSEACQFTAQDFEDWLKRNRFSMFKDAQKVEFENVQESKDGKTTYGFHHWMMQNNIELAKEVGQRK